MKPKLADAAPLADLAPEILRLVPQLTDEQWAARDAEVAAQRAAELERTPNERLIALPEWGFPKRAVRAVQFGIVPPASVTRLRDSFGDDIGIVVLSGPKGVGKTVAATWWAASRRDRVGFLRAATFASESRYDRDERRELFSHPLVLDDLGAEFADAKGSFLVDLDELIDTYYGDMRPLMITTNCTGEEFRARYGERIADRLRECGRWISLTGESMRRRR